MTRGILNLLVSAVDGRPSHPAAFRLSEQHAGASAVRQQRFGNVPDRQPPVSEACATWNPPWLPAQGAGRVRRDAVR
jgi:hypothetical protein